MYFYSGTIDGTTQIIRDGPFFIFGEASAWNTQFVNPFGFVVLTVEASCFDNPPAHIP